MFATDLWANDWIRVTPKQELALLIKRLRVTNRGIILLHEPKAQTAAMLPDFLRYLREGGYRIVHLVPAKEPALTSTPLPDQKHLDRPDG